MAPVNKAITPAWERSDMLRRSLSPGFSLVEVVLAIAIGSLALAGTIMAFSSHLVAGKRAADRNTVEETIARDIGWIRNYAKLWKMQSGPYDLSNSQTFTTNAFENSPYISYSPNSGGSSCTTGLAPTFISNASSVSGVLPSRPFAISTSSTDLTLSRPVAGVSLSRTINYANPNDTITITYALTGGPAASSLAIERQTSIYIEAAAWCAS